MHSLFMIYVVTRYFLRPAALIFSGFMTGSVVLELFGWAIIEETQPGGPGFRYENGVFHSF